MAGYFAWNRATSFLMSGTHVQKVRFVLVDIALSIADWVIVLGAAVVALFPALPEQAVRSNVPAVAVANKGDCRSFG